MLYVNYYELTSCVRLCRIKLKLRVTIGAFIASKMSESFFQFHAFKTKIFILLFSHDVILCFYSRG